MLESRGRSVVARGEEQLSAKGNTQQPILCWQQPEVERLKYTAMKRCKVAVQEDNDAALSLARTSQREQQEQQEQQSRRQHHNPPLCTWPSTKLNVTPSRLVVVSGSKRSCRACESP